MSWGVNEKAAQKRQRQANKKRQQQQKKEQKKQKQKWKDQFTEKKIESAHQKQEKRQKELARKKQLKQLAQKQQAEMAKQVKKQKGEFNEKKITQAQIQEMQQQRQVRQMQRANQQYEEDYPQQNVNRNLQQYQIANTVQKALNILDDSQQRHPERRFKAAFEAYCQQRQAQIKLDNPTLKRSQRQQMMRKQFQKHPQNPYNKKNLVAYNYNPKKEQKQQKQDD